MIVAESRGVEIRYPTIAPHDEPLPPLHTPEFTNRSKRWCGPTALSAVTGLDTELTTRLIRHVSGRRRVTGVSKGTMARALRFLGYRCRGWRVAQTERGRENAPTFAAWLRARPREVLLQTFIVNVTRHYMVARGQKVVDSETGKPVWLTEAPRRRARVRWVMLVPGPVNRREFDRMVEKLRAER